ncbi:MAG: protein phosphatase 2C domain-containing protein [Gemmatimonadota bacterium]
MSGRATLVIGGATHVGRVRAENQDTFLAAVVPAPSEGADTPGSPRELAGDESVSATVELTDWGVLLIVADGMGGPAGGGVASRLAVASIVAEVMSRSRSLDPSDDRAVERVLTEAVGVAHAVIGQRAGTASSLAAMGTTATVAWVLPGRVRIAQVGDSRAYLVRGGRSEQLTRDQTLVQQWVDEGRMTPAEAEVSPQRNVLVGALAPGPMPEVEIVRRSLQVGDALVLCSDGLTEVVKGPELPSQLEAAASPIEAAQVLVELANERGGPDNVTVLVGRVGG